MAAFVIGLPSIASADLVVQMNANWEGGFAYRYHVTDIVDVDTGQSALGGSGYIICFDHHADPPGGAGEQYTFTMGPNVFYHPEAQSRGLDLVNWLVNTSYEASFNPATDFLGSRAFQYVLWKLAHDFDGSNLSTLTFDTGAIQDPDFGEADIADALLTMLKTTDIPTGYRSQDYFVTFLKNGDGFQNMLYFTTEITNGISTAPEPSTFALGLAGLPILALVARRRAARGRRKIEA